MTHVFIDDNTDWLDRIRRCGYHTGEYGAICSLPAGNRIHDLPDTTAQDEHRRRAGEGDQT